MIQLVCSGLAWLGFILPLQLVDIASVSTALIAIRELGDSGPEVIDTDMWWEIQFILGHALTNAQISPNRKV